MEQFNNRYIFEWKSINNQHLPNKSNNNNTNNKKGNKNIKNSKKYTKIKINDNISDKQSQNHVHKYNVDDNNKMRMSVFDRNKQSLL